MKATPEVRIVLNENRSESASLSALQTAAGDSIDVVREKFAPLVDMRPTFLPNQVAIAAGTSVGTLRVGALRIDVMPRLAAVEFVVFVRYALRGRVDPLAYTVPPTDRLGLEELLGAILADEASRVRQIGLSRRYQQRRERLRFLRGRPDFLGSFPWDEARLDTLVCSYHLLTCDNLDNRLMRAALERACLLDLSPATRRRLLDHRKAWSAIADEASPSPSDFTEARARYTRLSEHYRLAHNIGELLVTRRRPSGIGIGPVTTQGFVLEMPWLFEKFVERLVAELVKPLGITVESQQPDHGALLNAEGSIYRRVRPDLVLYKSGTPRAVVDAKYKDYWPADASGSTPERKVANEDLYQLFFYSQRLQHKYGLDAAPKAYILAPLPAEDERGGRDVIGMRHARVIWRAGGECAGDVRLVLVPVTDLLRAWINMAKPVVCEELPKGVASPSLTGFLEHVNE